MLIVMKRASVNPHPPLPPTWAPPARLDLDLQADPPLKLQRMEMIDHFKAGMFTEAVNRGQIREEVVSEVRIPFQMPADADDLTWCDNDGDLVAKALGREDRFWKPFPQLPNSEVLLRACLLQVVHSRPPSFP